MAIKRAANGGQIFIPDKKLNEKDQEKKQGKWRRDYLAEKSLEVNVSSQDE